MSRQRRCARCRTVLKSWEGAYCAACMDRMGAEETNDTRRVQPGWPRRPSWEKSLTTAEAPGFVSGPRARPLLCDYQLL